MQKKKKIKYPLLRAMQEQGYVGEPGFSGDGDGLFPKETGTNIYKENGIWVDKDANRDLWEIKSAFLIGIIVLYLWSCCRTQLPHM